MSKNAQLGDKNSARAKRASAKRKAGGRWSVLDDGHDTRLYRFCYRHGGTENHPAEWAEVHVICGEDGTAARIVAALNRARVTLKAVERG